MAWHPFPKLLKISSISEISGSNLPFKDTSPGRAAQRPLPWGGPGKRASARGERGSLSQPGLAPPARRFIGRVYLRLFPVGRSLAKPPARTPGIARLVRLPSRRGHPPIKVGFLHEKAAVDSFPVAAFDLCFHTSANAPAILNHQPVLRSLPLLTENLFLTRHRSHETKPTSHAS